MAKLFFGFTFESLLRDAGKMIVPRQLLERAMHALEEADDRAHRQIGREIENLLAEYDAESNDGQS